MVRNPPDADAIGAGSIVVDPELFRRGAYQRLQETGYRSADSQEFTFKTGN